MEVYGPDGGRIAGQRGTLREEQPVSLRMSSRIRCAVPSVKAEGETLCLVGENPAASWRRY